MMTWLLLLIQQPKIWIFLNAKLSESVIIETKNTVGNYNYRIFNCKGDLVNESDITLNEGIFKLEVPASGMIQLTLK